ncbi:MAG: hypothetical protein IKG14_03975 [Clostridia bacterium]|nr:hypothetical protein [Clostridia bacterium]
MLVVINKDKIFSYLVSFSTVAILFTMSFFMTQNNERILDTSTKAVEVNTCFFDKEQDNATEENGIKSKAKNEMISDK